MQMVLFNPEVRNGVIILERHTVIVLGGVV